VSLRAFRIWRGLTLEQLAHEIRAQGVEISKIHLNNVELGNKQTTALVMNAWARALGINPVLIRTGREIRQYLEAVDEDQRADLEPAA